MTAELAASSHWIQTVTTFETISCEGGGLGSGARPGRGANESGRIEVCVQRFSEPTDKRHISTRGGTEPLWGRDGRELFFREREKVIAVPIAAEPLLKPREPRTPFSGDYILRAYRAYDYDRKSDRFLMAKLDESETNPKELEVVVNWFDELKRLAPTPSGR